ncbi:MAG: PilZ domain-containing protein [Candidatus Omnitrophota bacterium]
MANQERRVAKRVKDEELLLKIIMGGFDTSTHTLNISSSGLYCKVDKDMPLMSRVKLMLMIPDVVKSDREAKGIEVEGVVVRAHPVIISGEVKHYDVAIFFDSLEPRTKELISNYISRKNAA